MSRARRFLHSFLTVPTGKRAKRHRGDPLLRAVPVTLLLTLLPAVGATAQEGTGAASGKAVTPESYYEWMSIAGAAISSDGEWVVYTLSPYIGEGELVVRATEGTTEYRVPRGYISRPSASTGFGGYRAPAARITADSKWVVFMIAPSEEEVEEARKAKKKPDDQPKSTLAILDLGSGEVTRIPNVRSVSVPGEGPSVIVYMPEPEKKEEEGEEKKEEEAKKEESDTTKKEESEKATGSTIVLRDLGSGSETTIDNVTSRTFSDDGTLLGYIVSTEDGEGDGVFVRPLSGGEVTTVATGAGRYQSLTFDEEGDEVAFLSDKAEYGAKRDSALYSLYHAKLDGESTMATALVGPGDVGEEMIVSTSGSATFTKDGAGVRFGFGPEPVEPVPADSLQAGAVFDLWHYEDPYLQPAQKLQAQSLRNIWFDAIYWLDEGRWVRLGTESYNAVRLNEDATVGMATTNDPYLVRGMWGDTRTDVYLVDPRTGGATLVRKAMEPSGGPVPRPGRSGQGSAFLSPGGKYVLMYERRHWHSYNVATGETVNLTEHMDVAFWNETDDHPALPGAYGFGAAGWTAGDEHLLLRDRFDIWAFDPTGATPARNVTEGMGRSDSTTFNLMAPSRFDPDAGPYIDPKEPFLLSATNIETKATGIFEDRIEGTNPPVQLVMGDMTISVSAKARDAGRYLVTKQTFRVYPDLWVGSSFDDLTRISNANPQQAGYRWGTAQLVHFTSRTGLPLKAVLYKPDGFDPSKKYPMMVHIYEIMTNGLHRYRSPRASGGSINISTFVSNGYLVLTPDIVYEDGHPGMSSVNAVLPAVEAMIDSGYVNPEAIGIEGYSWGGYESAFIVTKSDLFAAAAPGSPVSNMSSAWGGIRWGSGVNRSMQYERTQSRIGFTPWERPDLYIENSPTFHAQHIRTPILMQHNDDDGAVPWYQGIEYYIALRRMGAEIYFFNYNGSGHGLRRTKNVLDWDRRLWQFFDHHLRGAPKPDWMEHGVPFIHKGRDQAATTKGSRQ